MNNIAELRNATKTYDRTIALDNVNLKIKQAEILVLLGANGSGKTTLLRILALIERPTEGDVYLLGEKVTEKNIGQARMESTMVFQKTMLFNTSVNDNIAYGLRIRKMPKKKIDEEVRKALGLVRLEGFENRRAKRLSGGEQQRVALARALVLNTKLLLLDEPTANLDPKNASIIEEAIATTNRELKTTIVMATHNMFQAKSLPHRIALIDDGKISEVGSPTEIFGRLSTTLASFAMTDNTFSGTAKVMENGTTLVNIGDGLRLEATAQRNGSVVVLISPNDIILSKNPISSSARNVLKGKITEILDLDPVVRLRVNAGKPFTVHITRPSFNDMQLNLNSEVFMVFKASSVQVL